MAGAQQHAVCTRAVHAAAAAAAARALCVPRAQRAERRVRWHSRSDHGGIRPAQPSLPLLRGAAVADDDTLCQRPPAAATGAFGSRPPSSCCLPHHPPLAAPPPRASCPLYRPPWPLSHPRRRPLLSLPPHHHTTTASAVNDDTFDEVVLKSKLPGELAVCASAQRFSTPPCATHCLSTALLAAARVSCATEQHQLTQTYAIPPAQPPPMLHKTQSSSTSGRRGAAPAA